MNKWAAQITVEGKHRCIGYYEIEEEAAVDYARALFKYNKDKVRVHRQPFVVDLTDAPPQSPILKTERRIKEGASKYTGVSFHKRSNKWQTQISIEGKVRRVGVYENEEEAAVDYARALFKYKGQGTIDKAREQRLQNSFIIDLSDVPTKSPIPKSSSYIKDGASKYTGVTFHKQVNRWQAQITIEGTARYIGNYKSEEEAAVDYARAVFKYKGNGALERAMEKRSLDSLDKARVQSSFVVDLSGVSPKPPMPKSAGHIK